MQISEGYPATGSPKIRVLTIIMHIKIKANIHNNIPIIDAIANGAVENATIPSKEYKNSFQNDHLVSPATRSTFSYSNHFVLYQTKKKIPFENLLYSFKLRIESTICLVIIL